MNELPLVIQSKDLIGLLLFFAGTAVATAMLLFWPRLREGAFFLMAGGMVVSGLCDLDVYSAYWYRGTSRGFEITFFDLLALGLLFSSLLSPRPDEPRRYWPASLGFMVVFLLYCIGVTVTATPMIFGWFEITKLVRGIVFFLATALFVRRERELALLVVALALAMGFETLLALRERLFLDVWRPMGSLSHPNSLSMFTCMVTPVLVAGACSTLAPWVRRLCWAAVAGSAIIMVLTLSRAGLPIFVVTTGATVAWCVSWRPTPGRFAVSALVLMVLTGIVAKSWPLIMERFGQATLQEEYFEGTGETRGYYFRQAAVVLDAKPFGVGLNNWSYWVSKEYGKPLDMHYENYDDIIFAPPIDQLSTYRYAAPAHNLGALTAGEIGWVGLALLLVMWARWLAVGAGFLFSRRPEAMRRLGVGLCFGMLAVLLHSFTEWTFRQTQIFLVFHLLAGVLAALHRLKQAEPAEAEEFAPAAADEWPVDPAAQPVPLSPYHN
jgi:hypothetical protein